VIDLCEELLLCRENLLREKLSYEGYCDCRKRIHALMADYLKPYRATTNHQETESDQA
jgi:hypothetical protein